MLSLYGRSENLVTTTCSVDDDVSRALTSDGAAMPGAEVKISRSRGNEVPRGAEGDIAYRGPAHMIEYLGQPRGNRRPVHRRGLLAIGRSGRDDRRRLCAGDRQDQGHCHSRWNGTSAFREIEDNLADHPALHASSCVGMPDERLGEQGVLLCGR